MNCFESISEGEKKLYKDGFFVGDYAESLYLKKSVSDGSLNPKYFLSVASNINGELRQQGHIYFYLDEAMKTSYFVGVLVPEQYRNMHLGSLLVASWIDMCLNNGYDFMMTAKKQRKPFLLYMLKTYGFEIMDPTLYYVRDDVIKICRSYVDSDLTKKLAFVNAQHEKEFMSTNIFKTDNYEIVHDLDGVKVLDQIILPIQNQSKSALPYMLLDHEQAEQKVMRTLKSHKR